MKQFHLIQSRSVCNEAFYYERYECIIIILVIAQCHCLNTVHYTPVLPDPGLPEFRIIRPKAMSRLFCGFNENTHTVPICVDKSQLFTCTCTL